MNLLICRVHRSGFVYFDMREKCDCSPTPKNVLHFHFLLVWLKFLTLEWDPVRTTWDRFGPSIHILTGYDVVVVWWTDWWSQWYGSNIFNRSDNPSDPTRQIHDPSTKSSTIVTFCKFPRDRQVWPVQFYKSWPDGDILKSLCASLINLSV